MIKTKDYEKILYALALLAGTICLVVACSNDEPDTGNGNQDMEEVVPGTNHKILIAYFPSLFLTMWMR